jgi:hypothetical protein
MNSNEPKFQQRRNKGTTRTQAACNALWASQADMILLRRTPALLVCGVLKHMCSPPVLA